MRFSCHSSQNVIDANATSSKKKQTRVAVPEGKRKTSARLQEKAKKVAEAKKRSEKKAQVEESNARFIWVGNLYPGTSEATLRAAFSQFGIITQVVIRCSQGQYVTAPTIVPERAVTTRDRVYASVHFTNPKSAKRALRMNGIKIGKRSAIVTNSVMDLPESGYIGHQKVDNRRRRQAGLPPAQPKKTLGRTDTELDLDYTNPSTDRNRLFGISWGKVIM